MTHRGGRKHTGSNPGSGGWIGIIIFLAVAIPLLWYVLTHVGG